MLDTVKINHVQHISFTQSRLTDAVSVILSELLSYEHPSKVRGLVLFLCGKQCDIGIDRTAGIELVGTALTVIPGKRMFSPCKVADGG